MLTYVCLIETKPGTYDSYIRRIALEDSFSNHLINTAFYDRDNAYRYDRLTSSDLIELGIERYMLDIPNGIFIDVKIQC